MRKVQKKPAETVAPTLPSATAGDAPPKPPSKRQQRSILRLQEFQEKKKAAFVAELAARGCEHSHAVAAVARAERMRLERIAASRAAPMEADAAPSEGHPSGSRDGQTCGSEPELPDAG